MSSGLPLLPFAAFALAGSITPGPNVLMIAAAASGSGVRATLPHMLGVAIGFGAMILMVGLGLAVPLASFPWLHAAMRLIGAAWVVWIAWQIAAAPLPGERAPRPPLGFVGAAMFQWVNPKAWMLALAMTTTWTDPSEALGPQFLAMAAIVVAVTFPCNLAWGGLGAQAGRMLRHPHQVRAFNIAMAVLLVVSMAPVLLRAE